MTKFTVGLSKHIMVEVEADNEQVAISTALHQDSDGDHQDAWDGATTQLAYVAEKG